MAVVADLDTFRANIGAISQKDDAVLSEVLEVATAHVAGRVYPDDMPADDVQYAILLLANRLYKRRQSPEGTAGFGGEGVVVRILSNDPDVRILLERHLDCSDTPATGTGIG